MEEEEEGRKEEEEEEDGGGGGKRRRKGEEEVEEEGNRRRRTKEEEEGGGGEEEEQQQKQQQKQQQEEEEEDGGGGGGEGQGLQPTCLARLCARPAISVGIFTLLKPRSCACSSWSAMRTIRSTPSCGDQQLVNGTPMHPCLHALQRRQRGAVFCCVLFITNLCSLEVLDGFTRGRGRRRLLRTQGGQWNHREKEGCHQCN